MKDFYYILGVNRDCTLDEIKDAYRKLSKKLHPDLNQGDAYFENRFKDINEAFETLRDPVLRAQYDRQLKANQASHAEQTPPERPHRRTQPTDYSKFRKRGPGLGMTVVLVLLALIVSDYLIREFNHSKAIPPRIAYVSGAVNTGKLHKLHKKKHSLKGKTTGGVFKPKNDSINTNSPQAKPVLVATKSKPLPVPPEPKPAPPGTKPKPEPVAVVAVPVPVRDEKPAENSNYLYSTSVRANATGVVYMRRHSDYSSDVIEKIPANSKVFVLEKGEDYYRIAFNSNIGYVPKWALLVK